MTCSVAWGLLGGGLGSSPPPCPVEGARSPLGRSLALPSLPVSPGCRLVAKIWVCGLSQTLKVHVAIRPVLRRRCPPTPCPSSVPSGPVGPPLPVPFTHHLSSGERPGTACPQGQWGPLGPRGLNPHSVLRTRPDGRHVPLLPDSGVALTPQPDRVPSLCHPSLEHHCVGGRSLAQ